MKYLILYLSVFLVTLSGCQSDDACADYNSYIETKHFNIVVLKQNDFGREYVIEGYEPISKKKSVFKDTGGLYITIRSSTEIGDTLVKFKHKPYFVLRKKKFDLKFEIKCNGQTPISSPADTIPKSGV